MSNRALYRPPTGLQAVPPPPDQVLFDRVCAAWRRLRSRQRIATLDARMLKDIGISYAEAEAEANKPFWRS